MEGRLVGWKEGPPKGVDFQFVSTGDEARRGGGERQEAHAGGMRTKVRYGQVRTNPNKPGTSRT